MRDEISPLTPLEEKPPKLSPPKNSAAGIPAVVSTMKYGLTNMGVINSISKLSKVNDFHGFDCPGCAWPDPDDHRSFAEFCENGAKAVSDEATKSRVDSNFWSKWSISELSQKSDFWLNSQGRLTEPMIIRQNSNYYQPISWEDAFDVIADNIVSLENPDEAIFYTSGRTSNEAAFLWQLLARRIGTNNLPDCSNMCHESSGVALSESIGIGKGTVTLEDFNSADLIIVVGQNPGTNHPRMLTALRDAKKKGASIISVNPLVETGMKKFKHPQNPVEMLGFGSSIADKHLRVKINSDQALFRAFSKSIIESDNIDEDFIDKYTNGFENFRKIAIESRYEEISEITGIPLQEILEISSVVKRMEKILEHIETELDILQVEKRIRGRVKRQMEKSQRDYYLNEQVKAIQKELGEGEDSELDDLEKKIASAGMSSEALEKAKSEVKKLKLMSPMSAEATVVRNYVDSLLALPWKRKSKVSEHLLCFKSKK